MADLAALQSKILYHLSSSGEPQVAMDLLQQKLNERSDIVSAAVRGLLENRKITLQTDRSGRGGSTGAGSSPRIFIALASNDMSESFSLVYEAIRAAGTSGIDQQQLAARLRIPKPDVLKALRSLTQAQRIQEQRSFTNRAKKVYLLFHLQPSAQVTGGTLYCGEDLDVGLVDELRQRIVSFISRFRSVGLRQIERFVEEQTAGVVSSNTDTAALRGGAGAGEDEFDLDNLANPVVKRERDEGDEDDWNQQPQQPGSPVALIHASGGTSLNNSRLGPPNSASPSSSTGAIPATLSDRTFPTSVSGRSMPPLGVAPPPSESIFSKRIQAKDVRALMQTLVLDGVVEELLGPFRSYYGNSNTDSLFASALGHEPRFQLATGGNVMRHFTAAPLERQQLRRGTAEPLAKRGRLEAPAEEEPSATARQHVAQQQRLQVLRDAMEEDCAWGPADVSKPSSSMATVPAEGLRDGRVAWAYMPAVGFPCLGCPQLASCSATGSGVINQRDCSYLAEWLK